MDSGLLKACYLILRLATSNDLSSMEWHGSLFSGALEYNA